MLNTMPRRSEGTNYGLTVQNLGVHDSIEIGLGLMSLERA